MTWSVPLPFRPPTALLSLRRYARPSRSRAARTADPAPGPSPLAVRRHAGCLLIEVRQGIGPAAEPHLGRLLHAAIHPGTTAVLVDLRHTADLGSSGFSVLSLARTLADRHGLPFGFVQDVPPEGRPPLTAARSALPPAVRRE